jgi:plastocyanin
MLMSGIRRGLKPRLRPDRLVRRAGPSKAPMLCVVSAAVALSGCGSQAAPPAPPARPVALAAAAADDPAATAQAQEGSISIKNFMFSPTSITVPAGTTVQWKNLDGEPHTVTGIEEPFRSGALDQNDSFSFKFSKPGTYRYVCSIHPQMMGTVTVK